MHKGRPFIKPMMVNSRDGYIVSVMGPFFADGKSCDAYMLNNMSNTNAAGIVDK